MKTRHPFTASGDADTPSKRITNPLEHSGGLRIELPGGTPYDYKLRTVTYYFKPVK